MYAPKRPGSICYNTGRLFRDSKLLQCFDTLRARFARPFDVSQQTEFIIRPNASFPRPSWRWLLLVLVIISLSIALRLAWLGFWMVLPFTLVELGFLVWLVHLVRRNGSYIEKICIEDEVVRIFHLQKDRDADWSFPLHWTRVDLRKPRHHWYPHRLLVGTSGRWVEIGQCLTDEERSGLASALRRAIQNQRGPGTFTYA